MRLRANGLRCAGGVVVEGVGFGRRAIAVAAVECCCSTGEQEVISILSSLVVSEHRAHPHVHCGIAEQQDSTTILIGSVALEGALGSNHHNA